MLTPALLLACLLSGPEPGLAGRWEFGGDLLDASGSGHTLAGPADFAPGARGQAWRGTGEPTLATPDSPDLRLAPGLTIECWVLFPERPTGIAVFAMKDGEYQLRLDPLSEGGQFSFFVHLDGWEPRLSLGRAEAGKWHHLLARWTGRIVSLEVDGRRAWRARTGEATSQGAPLLLGAGSGLLDEVRVSNPNLARQSLMEGPADGALVTRGTRFSPEEGFSGWSGQLGAAASASAEGLGFRLEGPAAVVGAHFAGVDVSELRILNVLLDCPGVEDAELVFATDAGAGVIPFPVWSEGRVSIVDASEDPRWRGALHYLGVGIPDGAAHEGILRGLWLSDRAEGPPWVYLRSAAPGRAVLRVGREESVVAVVRNLGAEARDVRVTLEAPEGLTVLDPVERRVARLSSGSLERLQWRVRAEVPLEGVATVRVAGGPEPGSTIGGSDGQVALRFLPPHEGPAVDYVPEPLPAETDYRMWMHYCPLWKEGTHYGWGKIEPWPERRPAIGYYDEGTPEVADWHIKQALEHGIEGFLYCWYRSDWSPEIHEMIGHAVHDGLLKSRYVDRFRFAIMWENANAKGVRDRADFLDNLLPYWIEKFWSHPSYLRVGGKPVLIVYQPTYLTRDLGGSEQVREAFAEARRRCEQAGLGGLSIMGCVEIANSAVQDQMLAEGYDASMAYSVSLPTQLPLTRDVDGAGTIDYRDWLGEERQTWLDKRAASKLPDLVTAMVGWDPRPWHGQQTTFWRQGLTPELFREACAEAKEVVDGAPPLPGERPIVVFDNWNEFGEGHYIEPCAGWGFGMLDAIRDVFCKPGPHEDIVPEDVGLAPPERAYARRREVVGLAGRERTVVDNLVGWWRFEEDDASFALDSSATGLHAAKRDFTTTEGAVGRGMLCSGGTATVTSDPLLYPREGITVSAWVRVASEGQTDRWIVNSIQAPHTGYRLGLDGGQLCWQVPLSEWSHSLKAPEPLPVGRWVPIAATFDGSALCLYVEGKLVGSLERHGAIRASRGDLVIGSYAVGHLAAAFEGALDELRLYNRALTASEIAELARPPR